MFDPANPIPTWGTSTMQRLGAEATIADAALRYANLGIPIFPCAPGGKQPLTTNGFHDATSSAQMVSYWWRRNPEANIGLPTGTRTGVVVVDIDVHGKRTGYGSFEQARGAGLAESWGWLVRTPSGGLHAYFGFTPETAQRNWTCPTACVDFRGDGGYVIAPPSHIEVNGQMKAYRVIATGHHGLRPIDAAALRQFLEPPRSESPRPTGAARREGCSPQALATWVARTPPGGRNDNLFRASCLMAQNNYSYLEVLSALGDAARYVGLRDREIERTIDSACRIVGRGGPLPASRLDPTRSSEGLGL
ncbi:MAG: bifunctional DNA primase/polymerase [Solirubrobacteraceae bacterium]